MAGPVFCGVDVGASATKLVLLDDAGQVLSRVVTSSGVDYAAAAVDCLEQALREAGRARAELTRVVATGYGRGNVDFAGARATEILCHARGCHHLVPRAITIVDIGGQDNKVIRVGEDGRQLEFKMNRKCAAGTGAFLEEVALRLRLPVEALDALAEGARAPVSLSSFCTVFAKTEILSHLRQGAAVADIVAGAFAAVVTRVLEMDPLSGEVVATGGVAAHSPFIATLMSRRLGREVRVPAHAQLTGALGAALVARAQG